LAANTRNLTVHFDMPGRDVWRAGALVLGGGDDLWYGDAQGSGTFGRLIAR